ncbi:MAG: DUF2079 domain-containing protein [Cellulomonas sp.]|uniref:DUF2079 domain-containing protein n=1 Tax=Cellulomonas sp. TaxID=40001 RepID=UPI0017C47841|nr:DUF2079 domain-containing protein [Cellulomonas sp.]NMM30987.1 DUF2079 domain-containing protein [Cellulomonas sp.]
MTVTLEGDRVAPPSRRGVPWSGWGGRLWRLVVRLGATWVGVWARRHPSLTIGLGALLLYAATSLVRFARMAAGIDLAIFTQAVQQYAQGHLPWSYLKAAGGFDLLGDHFSPVVALLAPFYRLWPDARLLLIAQAALVGLAAGIVTRSAIDALGKRTGAAIGMGFVLAWGTQAMALFDFHEVAFAMPLLALCLAALVRGHEVQAIVWALPLMLVKEDSVFLLLGIALYLVARRRWWPAVGVAGFALGAFALIVGVMIPAMGFYGRYTYWSSSAAAGGALTQLWTGITTGKAIVLVLILLAPSLGLAARSPLALIALPSLASRLTSANETYWGPGLHYNATVTVIMAFAAIDAVRRIRARRRWSDQSVARGAWVLVAAALVASCWLPLGHVASSALRPCPACAATTAALNAIPDHVSVAADDTLVAYLVDRDHVHELKPSLFDTTGARVFPEYVALDRSQDGIWAHPIRLDGWRNKLIEPAGNGGSSAIYQFVCEYVLETDTALEYDVMILRTPYPSSPR